MTKPFKSILAFISLGGRFMPALMLSLLTYQPALAWGPIGHQAIGDVADHLLSPAAQAAVARLLANDTDAEGRLSHRQNLAQIASWPDEIRGKAGDHPHWHYDNVPVCRPVEEPLQWCRQGECASAQLDHQLAILADDHRSVNERNVALKWVVHLVGDLHQPLHAADLAEGANRIRVLPHHMRADASEIHQASFHGHESHHEGESLHGFWDTRLVIMDLHLEHGSIPGRSLQHLIERAKAVDPQLLRRGPLDWALESNNLAREFALRLPGVDCRLENNREEVEVSLSDTYVARGRHVVDERLALAGARLAHQLNQALAAGR